MIEKIITGDFETNTYIISNQGMCIIVDPGLDFFDAAEEIKQKYEVKAILLTHGHMDHIDGIRYFDVPIYIHEKEIPFLEDTSLSLYRMFGSNFPFHMKNLNIIPIKEKMKIELIGYTFEVMHTPGHTIGSVVYSYRNKVLSGDTLFSMGIGRTDFPTGNFKMIKESLKKIITTFPDTYDVYPGHGEKTTIGFERKHNPYLS